MLKSTIVAIVTFCTRHARSTLAVFLLLGVAATWYSVQHFAINTDIGTLISNDLPWRKTELEFYRAFPERQQILVVIDAPTPELATAATARLADALKDKSEFFQSVKLSTGDDFFARNSLLYPSTDEVGKVTSELTAARPLLVVLASNPNLKGVSDGINLAARGVLFNRVKLDSLVAPMQQLSATLEDVLANRPASFSWRVLMNQRPATDSEKRGIIQVVPVLDFSALEPGGKASAAIRKTAEELKLASQFQARVRLSGPVAISDEEFATVREGAVLNHTLTVLAVLFILWLALRSFRIMIAVFISLAVGLAITAAFAFLTVGALNLISIAFAVLFIGLGVDFGIQFSVRYRSERFDHPDLSAALSSAAAKAGGPLALAAAAVTAAFYSFLPTDYLGLSELGLIAGTGMLIAFATSVTLLPALLRLLNPPGEQASMGWVALAPLDRFLERNRIPVVAATLIIALGGAPLLHWLQFDFNPLNLRNPKVESVATFLDLRNDPNTGINAIELLRPNLTEANEAAEKLAKLPVVQRTMTLAGFVPQNQDEKIALITKAAATLDTAINRPPPEQPPSDQDIVEAWRGSAKLVNDAAAKEPDSPGAPIAKALAALIERVANADAATRQRLHEAMVPSLQVALQQLRLMLKPQNVTLETLPKELTSDWITPDGRARVQVIPKGDPNDNEVLRSFAREALAVTPDATGMPVSILKSSETIVGAFIEAGIWSLLSIAVLLWITLRRITDVLLTLVPLILAGMITLEVCVLVGMPLNFANIIALPLLLGVGVAFKIYYIMAWRAGKTQLLQSTLTRAVVFSALTTATAFGSLWLSNHPGTSSMGKLMALSLVCTMLAAVLFQPALMGPPRQTEPP